jgi:hypothetical protein
MVATPRGGIQLEWLGPRGELEVAVEPEQTSVFLDLFQHPDESFERTVEPLELAGTLQEYIERLS